MYTKHTWENEHFFNFEYIQYLPKDFDETKQYPLLLFLHGAGARGDDLELVGEQFDYLKRHKDQGEEYPFIILAPQCPKDKYWGCYNESLLKFLDEMCAVLPVDKDRVYLSGLSMGGIGTWMLAMADNTRFAAIAPICGSGIPVLGELLVDIPAYIFHGDCDEIIPVQESINMHEGIKYRGGKKAQIKIFEGVKHNSWHEAYAGDALINWFLSHKRPH